MPVGSGTARVFATPCLAALMEAVCMHLVQPCLEEGIGTVGTALDIVHTAATPLGMTVTVEAVLLGNRRPPVYLSRHRPGRGRPRGEGTHQRCTVKTARFEEKAAARRPVGE